VALRHCTDLSAAAWLTVTGQPWHELVSLGPTGFPAYARLRFLPDPRFAGQREDEVDVGGEGPSEAEQLRRTLDTLADNTTAPDDCWFCLWDGWYSDLWGDGGATPGGRGPAFGPAVLEGPKVVVPHRAFFLFRGPLSDLGDWGAAEDSPGRPRLGMPLPAFVWPTDRAWCVTRDVDPHWAGIAADAAAIHRLTADPRLDVVPADPAREQPAYR